MLWIILLALSATVDSWAVGMTYKAQKIKIPLAAKGMISLVSGMTALIAVLTTTTGFSSSTAAFRDFANCCHSGIRRNAAGSHGRESIVADKKGKRKDQL